MSILTKKTMATGPGNPWANRVRVRALTEPWWRSSTTLAVAEVVVSGLLTVLVHVNRSKADRLYIAMPATKRGDEWLPVVVVEDGALASAIESAVLTAYAGAEE